MVTTIDKAFGKIERYPDLLRFADGRTVAVEMPAGTLRPHR